MAKKTSLISTPPALAGISDENEYKSAAKGKAEVLNKLIVDFCDKYLNKELMSLCQKAVAKLSRKRNVPFLSGGLEIWASAIVWAIARVNFLHDKASKHHILLQTVCDFYQTNKSTVGQKATQIEKTLRMQLFDPEYTTAEIQEQNPFNKLSVYNGFIVPKDFPGELF